MHGSAVNFLCDSFSLIYIEFFESMIYTKTVTNLLYKRKED